MFKLEIQSFYFFCDALKTFLYTYISSSTNSKSFDIFSMVIINYNFNVKQLYVGWKSINSCKNIMQNYFNWYWNAH